MPRVPRGEAEVLLHLWTQDGQGTVDVRQERVQRFIPLLPDDESRTATLIQDARQTGNRELGIERYIPLPRAMCAEHARVGRQIPMCQDGHEGIGFRIRIQQSGGHLGRCIA